MPEASGHRFVIRTACETTFNGESEAGDPLEWDDLTIEDLLNAEQHVPRFSVRGRLGHGGMARLVVVEDLLQSRRLAVKVVDGRDPTARATLEHEAAILARLAHPQIVPLIDSGLADGGLCWLSMPIIDGQNLHALAYQPLSPRRACALLAPIAEAVAYAHAVGIVHGDLNPRNILLTNAGRAVLVDWGSAEFLQGPAPTSARVAPAFAAPERQNGGRASIAADVYGLGACLFFLLHGQDPVAGPARRLPSALRRLLGGCLTSHPQLRFDNMATIAADLQAFAVGEPLRLCPESAPRRLWRWSHRHPRSAAAIVISMLLVALLGGVILRYQRLLHREWHTVLVEEFDAPLDSDSWFSRIYPLFRPSLREERPLGRADSPFMIRDGALETRWTDTWPGLVAFGPRRTFAADLRLQYVITGLDNTRNLNCFIGTDRFQSWGIHIGGFNRLDSITLTDGRLGEPLFITSVPLPEALQAGRAYEVTVELVGDRLRVLIDDRLVLMHQDRFGSGTRTSQRVGVETSSNRIRVERLLIEVLRRPQRIDRLTVPDRLLAVGAAAEAEQEYRQVDPSQLTAEERGRVRLQIGRCLLADDRPREACAHWHAMAGDAEEVQAWRVAAVLQLMQIAWDKNDQAALTALCEQLVQISQRQSDRLLAFNLAVHRLTTHRSTERWPLAQHQRHAAALEGWSKQLGLELHRIPLTRMDPSLPAWANSLASELLLPELREQLAQLQPALLTTAEQVLVRHDRHDAPEQEHGQLPDMDTLLEPRSSNRLSVRTLPRPEPPADHWYHWRILADRLLVDMAGRQAIDQLLLALDRIRPNASHAPQDLAVARAMLLLGSGERDAAVQALNHGRQHPLAGELPGLSEDLTRLLQDQAVLGDQWWSGRLGEAIRHQLHGRRAQAADEFAEPLAVNRSRRSLIQWYRRQLIADQPALSDPDSAAK
ncbi:MAG: protein kinase domain-containing protein [Planctomycetota bacterium]